MLGHLPQLRADPIGFVTRCARDHGDFVPLRLGPLPALLVNDPQAIQEILVTQDHNFVKPSHMRIMRRLLGNALIASDGEVWRRQRTLVDPAFEPAHLSGYADPVLSLTEQLAAEWRDGEQRDVYRDMADLTTRGFCKALFNVEMSREELDVVDSASAAALGQIQGIMTSSAALLPQAIPTPGNLRLRRAVRNLDEIVYHMIRDRRADGGDRRDLLSTLVRARDDHGALSGDRELRDVVVVLLLAGREPAVTLAWAWYLLARHPEEAAKLEAEIDTVLGDRAPTAADLPRLKAAERIVLETLRLYPAGWIIGRRALRGCVVAGHQIRRGAHVLVSPWVAHRDARYFSDPDAFRPERWMDGFADRLPRLVYFPHSAGPRACLGEAFTRREAILVLAALAQKFRLSLVEAGEVEPSPVLLRPRREIKMIVHRRR